MRQQRIRQVLPVENQDEDRRLRKEAAELVEHRFAAAKKLHPMMDQRDRLSGLADGNLRQGGSRFGFCRE